MPVEVRATPGEAYEVALSAIRDRIATANGTRPYLVTVVEVTDEEGCAYDVTVNSDPATVVRIRRITGYLSDSANWQKSKLAELKERKAHTGTFRARADST